MGRYQSSDEQPDDESASILLIEDNPTDARYIELLVEELDDGQYELVHVWDLAAGLEQISQESVDVVLLDLNLPDSLGLDTVRTLHSAAPSVPIVVLTATNEDQMAVQALQLGAQDYLPKDGIEPSLLVRSVRYAIERKRLTERAHAHLKAEQLIASLSSILIGVDEKGRVTRWNECAADTFGIPSRTVHGRPLRECDIPWIDEGAADEILSCLSSDVSRKFEDLRFADSDGRERLLSLTVSPVKTRSGDRAGLVLLGAETTEKRRLEEQLRQSQKLECVGQLAAGMSHEFKNLLTAVRGFTELAMHETVEDSEAYQYMEQVLAATERAAQITNQLLGFSRRQDLKRTNVQLNSAVSSVVEMLQPLIGWHINLTATCTNELWSIQADQGLLEQVLLNLCLNARDAMPDGGALAISTTNVQISENEAVANPNLHPGRYVCLTVTDTGYGMSPETTARIFEPFFTTKPRGKGTGLGLSMVYGIILQHQGVVDVQSEPGAGTQFAIYLPATNGEPTAKSGRQSSSWRHESESVDVVSLADSVVP